MRGDGTVKSRPLVPIFFHEEMASKKAGNAAIPSHTSVPEWLSVPKMAAAISITNNMFDALLHQAPAVCCETFHRMRRVVDMKAEVTLNKAVMVSPVPMHLFIIPILTIP